MTHVWVLFAVDAQGGHHLVGAYACIEGAIAHDLSVYWQKDRGSDSHFGAVEATYGGMASAEGHPVVYRIYKMNVQ